MAFLSRRIPLLAQSVIHQTPADAAAFDFHAGTVSSVPLWMREHGLEWLHRLASEPWRLWLRYLVTNTLFVLGAAWQQLLGSKR